MPPAVLIATSCHSLRLCPIIAVQPTMILQRAAKLVQSLLMVAIPINPCATAGHITAIVQTGNSASTIIRIMSGFRRVVFITSRTMVVHARVIPAVPHSSKSAA